MKTAVYISLACILLGVCLFTVGMSLVGFDLRTLRPIYTAETVYIEEAFDAVSVDTVEHDARFILTEDETCKLVYTKTDRLSLHAAVENGTLRITRTDSREWYERIGFFYGKFELTVYLPRAAYKTLFAKSTSGDVEVPLGFLAGKAELASTSGDVRFYGNAETLVVKSTSGDVKICGDGVQKSSSVRASTVSGNVTVEKAVGTDFVCTSVSGDVLLDAIRADGSLYAETTGGDIVFAHAVAVANAECKTVSGDVRGTLAKAMRFTADTVSGSIRFPDSDTQGGTFRAKTTSGDVSISLAE